MPRISFLFFPWVVSFTVLMSSFLSHHQFSFASVSPIISSSSRLLSMFNIVLSAAYWAPFSGCSPHSLLHRKTLILFLLKFMSLLQFLPFFCSWHHQLSHLETFIIIDAFFFAVLSNQVLKCGSLGMFLATSNTKAS